MRDPPPPSAQTSIAKRTVAARPAKVRGDRNKHPETFMITAKVGIEARPPQTSTGFPRQKGQTLVHAARIGPIPRSEDASLADCCRSASQLRFPGTISSRCEGFGFQ